jgi:hypothetical protein
MFAEFTRGFVELEGPEAKHPGCHLLGHGQGLA